MVLHSDHDPADYSGYTEFFLRIYDRFASVAVENHLSGNLSSINAHEQGVVDIDQLVSQYNLPAVFTVPTSTSNESRTTGADTELINFSVSVWVSDYDQQYAMIEAQTLIGEIVNNVEQRRSLTDANGDNPLAEDVTKTGTEFDFVLNPRRETGHLKYGTADFQVKTKRQIPTGNVVTP